MLEEKKEPEFNFNIKKVKKKIEKKKIKKNKIVDFCPNCNGKVYEVFINKLWRCFNCNKNIHPETS